MIVTFYSFKGGVGRSMALANVANWLRLQNLKTLVIDWDLEAPGLENFFFSTPEQREKVRGNPGLIDLLIAYRERHASLPVEFFAQRSRGGEAPPAADTSAILDRRADILASAMPSPDRLAIEVFPENQRAQGTLESPLHLLPAGIRDVAREEHYARDVQSLDWNEFYEQYDGSVFFHWLRRSLEGYDLVLIDSRTGFTEVGGVCTRELADLVIAMTAPNAQNIDGCVRMTQSFYRESLIQARQGRPLHATIVPARCENAENDLLLRFSKEFKGRLEALRGLDPDWRGLDPDVMWELRIRYIPKYAYGEELCVGGAGANPDLESDFSALGRFVVDAYMDVLDERRLSALSLRSPLLAELVRRRLGVPREDPREAAYQALSPEQQSASRPLLLQLVGLADPEDPDSAVALRWPVTDLAPSTGELVEQLRSVGLLRTVQARGEGQPPDGRGLPLGMITLSDPEAPTKWPRLAGWIGECLPILAALHEVRRLLTARVGPWPTVPEGLLPGLELLLTQDSVLLSPREREFISHAILVSGRQELDTRRRRVRTIGLLAALVALAALVPFVWWAWSSRRASATGLVLDARTLWQAGNRAGANAKIAQALRLRPDLAEAHGLRGEMFLASSAPDSAVWAFSKAIESGAHDATTYRLRGEARFASGDFPGALTDYALARERSDQDPVTYFQIGRTLQNTGEDSLAIANYSRAIFLKSDYWDAYLNRAVSLQKRGNRTAAIRDLQAVESGTQDASVRASAQARLRELQPVVDSANVRSMPQRVQTRISIQYVNPLDESLVTAFADLLRTQYRGT